MCHHFEIPPCNQKSPDTPVFCLVISWGICNNSNNFFDEAMTKIAKNECKYETRIHIYDILFPLFFAGLCFGRVPNFETSRCCNHKNAFTKSWKGNDIKMWMVCLSTEMTYIVYHPHPNKKKQVYRVIELQKTLGLVCFVGLVGFKTSLKPTNQTQTVWNFPRFSEIAWNERCELKVPRWQKTTRTESYPEWHMLTWVVLRDFPGTVLGTWGGYRETHFIRWWIMTWTFWCWKLMSPRYDCFHLNFLYRWYKMDKSQSSFMSGKKTLVFFSSFCV